MDGDGSGNEDGMGTNQVAETDWTVETVQMEWKQRPAHTPGPRDCNGG